MNGLKGKTKVIILIAGFIIFVILMFLFGYGIMGDRNQNIADALTQRRVELEVLQREQKTFEQGKKDLAELEEAQYPPDDLFSRDTKLVKEIQQLEAAAQLYNLNLQISISGTTKTAVKVPNTTGEIFAIPYTITLTGSFSDASLFMQVMERLPFVTHAKMVNVTVGAKDESRTVINSEFFIKK